MLRMRARVSDVPGVSPAACLNEFVGRKPKFFCTPSQLPGQEQVTNRYSADVSVSAADCEIMPGVRLGVPGQSGAYARTPQLAAAVFGGTHAIPGAGGSTQMNKIVARALALRGGDALLGRNAHQSIVDSVIDQDIEFSFLSGEYDSRFEAHRPLTARQLDAQLRHRGGVGAVLLTDPTYEGRCGDLRAIAEVVHRDPRRLLIVDQAWAAGFPFHRAFPQTALELGADMAVYSIHKLGGSLQPGAVLAWKDTRIPTRLIDTAVGMEMSTSQDYVVHASVDATLSHMAVNGAAAFERSMELAHDMRSRLRRERPHLSILGDDEDGYVDPIRTTIDVSASGMSGYEVASKLSRRLLIVEKAQLRTITVIQTLQLEDTDADQLVDALRDLVPAVPMPETIQSLVADPFGALESECVENPRAALLAGHRHGRSMPLEAAIGLVSCERANAYPPGIPMLVPGYRVTPGAVKYLRAVERADGHISKPRRWNGSVIAMRPTRRD
jgi:arginine decarboxylase